MMKKLYLNNKGWGLKEMLIITGVLFFFLLIACYYVFILYNKLDNSASKQYYNMEQTIQIAAVKYHRKHPNAEVITLDELVEEGYMNSISDIGGHDCDGYVVFDQGDYDPFVSCNNYHTHGYNKNLE